MKTIRKGLGKGLGMGYKNIAPLDSHIHSLSAKGQKTKMLYGKSIAVWSCPCGYGGTKGEMTKHKMNCSTYKKWKDKDDKFKKELGLDAKTLKDVAPSERYKVGKQIMGWDESDITDGEVEYRLENWKDAGYDKKPTEEQVRNDVYEDSDIYTWAWEDLMENLKESMAKKNPNGYWRAEVKNFGWRSSDGSAPPFYTEDPAELLRKILPDTDNTFKIFNYGKGYAVQNYHHDSPTGREWYYIVPISDTEYEQLREEGW